jgi:hypothetical protein
LTFFDFIHQKLNFFYILHNFHQYLKTLFSKKIPKKKNIVVFFADFWKKNYWAETLKIIKIIIKFFGEKKTKIEKIKFFSLEKFKIIEAINNIKFLFFKLIIIKKNRRRCIFWRRHSSYLVFKIFTKIFKFKRNFRLFYLFNIFYYFNI